LGFIGMNTCSYTRNYDYVRYFEKARHYYDLNKFEIRPPISVIPLSSYLCRVNSEEKGEMERYIEAVSAAIPHASVTFGGCGLGMDDLCRAELAFFRGGISGAEQFALRAIASARQGNQYEVETRALFYLLRINLARGNYGAIQDILQQIEAQRDKQDYPTRFIDHDIVSGWFYAHIGQTEKLASWLKNDFEESDLNSIVFGMEIMVKAKNHFSEKRFSAALSVLESRETKNKPWAFVLGKIEMKALEALCRFRLKDKDGAFAALAEAFRLANPNALFMPFTELGEDMQTLAEAALKEASGVLPRDWLERVRADAAAYAVNKKVFYGNKTDHP
jgi:LuxR family maltose regulon positive regulatory protein